MAFFEWISWSCINFSLISSSCSSRTLVNIYNHKEIFLLISSISISTRLLIHDYKLKPETIPDYKVKPDHERRHAIWSDVIRENFDCHSSAWKMKGKYDKSGCAFWEGTRGGMVGILFHCSKLEYGTFKSKYLWRQKHVAFEEPDLFTLTSTKFLAKSTYRRSAPGFWSSREEILGGNERQRSSKLI